jgi:hypothetical protein
MMPAWRCIFKFLAVLAVTMLGGGGRAHSAPVVILKLDDLRATTSSSGFSAAWDRLFNYVDAKPLARSVGIIGNSLESTNPAYTASIRRIHATGRVEFWNHGYLHVNGQPAGTYEFKGTGLTYQQTNFQTTQSLARERLGFPFVTFGVPYNQTDDVTRQLLEADPDMQTTMFGPATSTRLLDLKRRLNMEIASGVLDCNTLVANYPAQRQRPYLVLQGHLNAWDEAVSPRSLRSSISSSRMAPPSRLPPAIAPAWTATMTECPKSSSGFSDAIRHLPIPPRGSVLMGHNHTSFSSWRPPNRRTPGWRWSLRMTSAPG